MLAARRPLPSVLNRELFGVWFFKINLTVGQFWAPKGGPGADNMHNKIQDPGMRKNSPRFARFAAFLRRRELPVLPYLHAHLQDDARSKQTPSNYYYYYIIVIIIIIIIIIIINIRP